MDFNALSADVQKNARHILNNYANFDGRAGLREFWLWFLPLLALCLLLQGLGQILSIFYLLSGLISLALAIPSLAVGARRLHDTGRSGWLQLLLLIPVAGLLVMVYFWAQPSGKA
ncbi:MAG TPA: DUF805 domain-containing protein [Alphaproteobacteria bacterium]|nr:DUF805 domain-containing protein [Rhodospirillaceae bacterium]HRJ65709.1 DUF805 domain-containing protein [Alphaproteobacteria bacterium]